jgi:hypothetical protein
VNLCLQIVVEIDQDKEHEDLSAYAKTLTTITAVSLRVPSSLLTISVMDGRFSVGH